MYRLVIKSQDNSLSSENSFVMAIYPYFKKNNHFVHDIIVIILFVNFEKAQIRRLNLVFKANTNIFVNLCILLMLSLTLY